MVYIVFNTSNNKQHSQNKKSTMELYLSALHRQSILTRKIYEAVYVSTNSVLDDDKIVSLGTETI